MVIRLRLAIWFAIISSTILVVFSIMIFLSSSSSRRNDFFNRLHERALITAYLATDFEDFDRSLLMKIDTTAVSLEQEQVMLFDREGVMVYNNRAVNRHITPQMVKEVYHYKYVRFKLANDFEGVGIEYGNADYSYAVIISAIDKHGLRKLNNLKISLMVGTLLGMIISLVAGLFFARRALKPISTVVDSVNSISERNLHARLDEGNGKDEISELASTFNRMLQRLERAFEMQKAFVSHASHDFRTPLTVMLSEIEVMMLQHPENAELQRMLLSLKEEILNLNSLSSKLLNLAKASVDSSNIRKATFRVDEVLFAAIGEYSKAYPHSKVLLDYFELPTNEEQLIVVGEDNLLQTAFVNFISNGCKFSSDSTVTVSLKGVDGGVLISFKDNGVGIDKGEIAKIFEPFYRVQSNSKVPGHGLGLALTARIIELHEGHIEVESELGHGATFKVFLPSLRVANEEEW